MPTMEITTMIGCPMMCTFCPQKKLRAAYDQQGGDKYMSVETFQMLLDKLPPHVRIDFSGMSEPWANPEATKFLQMALEQNRTVSVFTTLYGISIEDSQKIVDLLVKHEKQVFTVHLHLPDENMNMRGYKGSDVYKQVLINFLTVVAKGDFPLEKFHAMTMDAQGHIHPDLRDILPQLGPWTGHSRAGSLDEEQVQETGAKPAPHNDFTLCCFSSFFYDHNVFLPNGDVVLCCMDYSLRHVLGNLKEMDYWDLFSAEPLNKLRAENHKPFFSACSLCKTCHNVLRFDINQNHMWDGRPAPTAL